VSASKRSRSEAERYGQPERTLFAEFRAALARGESAPAQRGRDGAWCVNAWVKKGSSSGFRMGVLTDMSAHPTLRFFDKDTYPVAAHHASRTGCASSPGDRASADGAYVARGGLPCRRLRECGS